MTVVLVGADAAALGEAAATLRAEAPAGARVGVFVGDTGEEAVWAAAATMAAEQYGEPGLRLETEAGAFEVAARPPAASGARPARQNRRLP
jgi:hypothetical protein